MASSESDIALLKKDIFFKTRLCVKFQIEGTCEEGGNCNYAHGDEELRHSPPNWKGLIYDYWKLENDGGKIADKKRKGCKYYMKLRECPFGESCQFLHDPGTMRESSAITIPTHHRPPQIMMRESSAITINTTDPPPKLIRDRSAMIIGTTHPPPNSDPRKGSNDPQSERPVNTGARIPPPEEKVAKRLGAAEASCPVARIPRKMSGIYGDWPDNLPPLPRNAG